MNTLLVINSILFAFLAFVWTRKNFTNLTIKFILLVLAVTNLLAAFGLVK